MKTTQLNHTIVSASDKLSSATFLTEMLGLASPIIVGPFAVVQLNGGVSLDYIDTEGSISSQHYAFLATEEDFDQIFATICNKNIQYWADPHRPVSNWINRWDGGRGIYFEDPNGHLLEVITRPYGSGGTTTTNTHPLFGVKDDKIPEDLYLVY